MYFFASEAVIPMRQEARESSEMISQLVFGDIIETLDSSENWLHARCVDDGYEGWVSSNMLTEIDQVTYESLTEWEYVLRGGLRLEDGTYMPLAGGARIPLHDNSAFQIGKRKWQRAPDLKTLFLQPAFEAHNVAEHFRNAPYLWGGKSTFGIDCSGLMQVVYRICGVQLPRDSSQQALGGSHIAWKDRQPGDLAFFRKANQSHISHVGMVKDESTIIHASGKVRLDFLDENGIINIQTNQRTHLLVALQRY